MSTEVFVTFKTFGLAPSTSPPCKVIDTLSQLLDYMENTTRENAVSEELEAIQEMVDVVKEDAEVTVAYMKGFERDQMFLEEGKKQERENTLKEKQRADEEQKRADMEQKRADAAAEEIAKLRKQLEELQNSQN